MASQPFPHINFTLRLRQEDFVLSLLRNRSVTATSMSKGVALAALAGAVSACGVSTELPRQGPTPPPMLPPPSPLTLQGEAGINNRLIGTELAPYENIEGNDGNDVLGGGPGSSSGTYTLSDTFTVSAGKDIIIDFAPVRDDIRFSASDMPALSDLTFTLLPNNADYHDGVRISGYDTMKSHLDLADVLAGDNIDTIDDWFLGFVGTTSQFQGVFSNINLQYVDGSATHNVGDGNDSVTLNMGTSIDRLFGFGGDDELTGSGDDNTIFGGDGDDTINGAGGKDTLYGGNGSDTINGGDDDDRIFGDGGDDVLNGGGGDDELAGGGGADVFQVSAGTDTVTDYSRSFFANDIIGFSDFSDGGSNTISGLRFSDSGDDLQISFADGGSTHTMILQDVFDDGGALASFKDTDSNTIDINGVTEAMTAFAHTETTSVSGSDTTTASVSSYFADLQLTIGSDTLNDEANTVTLTASGNLFGFGGDDELTGFTGGDRIFGGGGDDTLLGANGADMLFGGGDDDTLYGGAGDDSLTGGSGQDTFSVSQGSDTVADFRESGSDYIGFSALLNDAGITSATVSNLQFAHVGDDLQLTFVTGGATHTLTLQDTLTEGGTFDRYNERDDDGNITATNLDDLISAVTEYGDGSGSSRYFQDLQLTYGSGSDTTNINNSNNTITLTAGITDTLYGLGGSDHLTGNVGDNIIYGGAGGDDINGEGGNDTLYGGSGSDDFYASAGTDTIKDFTTSDDLFFRDGDTMGTGTFSVSIDDVTFAVNSGNADHLDIAYEIDLLTFSNMVSGTDTTTVTTTISVTTGTLTIENLLGENNPSVFGNSLGEAVAELTRNTSRYLFDLDFGTDNSGNTVNVSSANTFTATTGDDVFYGFQGNDELNGGGGSDKLYAGDGIDELDGGADNDELYGSDGNDMLDGGAGNDILSGGDDTDTFVVSGGSDTILDFRTTNDRDYIDFGGGENDYTVTIGKLSFSRTDDDMIISGYVVDNVTSTLTLKDVFTSGFGFAFDDLGEAVASITANEDRLTNDDSSSGYFINLDTDTIGDDEDNTPDDIDTETTYFALGGNDTVTVTSTNGAAIYGGDGEDVLTGSDGADILDGGNGNDTLEGGGGANTLIGGGGNDDITGGDASDTIDGGDGGDTIDGGAGADTIDGGSGGDTIDGGGGDDMLTGGSSGDSFTVSGGHDTITDLASGDRLVFTNATIGAGGLTLTKANSNEDLQIGGFSVDGTTATITLDGVFAEDGIFYDDSASAAVSDKEAFDMFASGDNFISGISNPADNITASVGGRAFGFDGDDRLVGAGGAEWLFGGSGDDVLEGMGGNDILYGGDGNDTITAGIGNDELDGGSGNDRLIGGDGNDTINGGSGNDTIFGNDDADTINGGDGNDTIEGGDGNDTFVVSSGSDTVSDFTLTASGGDKLDFSEFKDDDGSATLTLMDLTFRESGGNLTLTGFGGTLNLEDVLEEGNSRIANVEDFDDFQDLFYGSITNINRFIVNFANDIMAPDTIGDDSVNMLTATAGEVLYGFGGGDTLTADEDGSTIYGGDGNDTVSGGDASDTLIGGGGNDTISGGDNNDTLRGGAGNDTLTGQAGNDTLFGGKGNDMLVGDFTAPSTDDDYGNDIFIISDGTDTIGDFYSSDNPRTGERDIINLSQFGNADSEDIRFAQENNDLKITGYGAGNEVILQNIFASTGQFDGQDLNDALDVLTSSLARMFAGLSGRWNDGNNILQAEANIPLFGFGGNDTLSVSGDDDVVIFGGDGFDLITAQDGTDILYGGDGEDVISGNGGDDMLFGGRGGDTLNGGEGSDTLQGGDGRDTLNGGEDNDTLTGGTHADVFEASAGSDTITDFSMDDDDVLDFSDIVGVDRVGDLTGTVNGMNLQVVFSFDDDEDEDTADITATMTLNDVVRSGQTAEEVLQAFMTGDHLEF